MAYLVNSLKPGLSKEAKLQFIIDETTLSLIESNFDQIITELEKKVAAKKKATGNKLAKTIANSSGQDEDYGMEKFNANDLPEIQSDEE